MAFLTSLILGSGFAIVGQSVLAQNFGYNDYSDDSYSDYSSSYNEDPRDDKSYDSDTYDSYSDYTLVITKIQEMIKAMIQTHMTVIRLELQI